ncbi:MAG TPA: hypothetical protein VM680_06195 [Verrucomicrobiae bacterium]|nr:hypothetical protein [Verrucomicrobiae bacterium]
MHLLVDGMVEAGGSKSPGVMLIGEENVLFFHNNANVAVWAVAFGLLGALVSTWMAGKKADKNPPVHMNDPEVLALDARAQRKVKATRLLARIPFSPAISVNETRLGFQFHGADGTRAEISSWGNKKKIARALAEKGIPVIPRR